MSENVNERLGGDPFRSAPQEVPGSALIIVENDSVPQDPRVWQQAKTLRDNGWHVDVLCMKGDNVDQSGFEIVDGIEITRVSISEDRESLGGFLREYIEAISRLGYASIRMMMKRRYDVVQICNPPDFLFAVALPHRLRGASVMFDQHDLSPELAMTKGYAERSLVNRALRAAERITYNVADTVLVVNESYKRIALDRGRCKEDDVVVVRNAPDLNRFRLNNERYFGSWRADRKFMLGYLGVIGSQDGVDTLIHLVREMNDRGYDTGALVLGDGPFLPSMKSLARDLSVDDRIEFLGTWPSERVAEPLQSADVCVIPDPVTPFNMHSTVAKTLEYLAMGRPVVGFDLPETRVSGGDVVQYAAENTTASLADEVQRLFDNDDRRRELAKLGQERVLERFTWEHSEPHLLRGYDKALAVSSQRRDFLSGIIRSG